MKLYRVLRENYGKKIHLCYIKRTKNISLLSASTPIKYLPDGKKVLRLLISKSIKEGNCCYAWIFVVYHCVNGSSQVQGIDFDHYYSPVAHAESFRINISVEAMHRFIGRVVYVSNSFHNTNVPVHGRVCVIPPPYY